MLRTATVLKKIACPHLALYAGQGYWYFVYDDTPNSVYDTHSVYTYRLSDMTLERWVAEGQSFVERVLAELATRS